MAEKKRRDPQAPKKVKYIAAVLQCQRCNGAWLASDLNPERKVVPCPVCGESNDIKEAIKRA